MTRPPRKVARIRAARVLLTGTPLLSAAALLNALHPAADQCQRERQELVLPAAGLDLDGVDLDADAARGRPTEIGHRQWLHVLGLLRYVLLLERTRHHIGRWAEARQVVGLTLQQREHVFVCRVRLAAVPEDARV